MTESKQPAATCPVCGGDNQCAIAAGQPPASCWCQKVTLDTATSRAQDLTRERCLCPLCGKPAQETRDAG